MDRDRPLVRHDAGRRTHPEAREFASVIPVPLPQELAAWCLCRACARLCLVVGRCRGNIVSRPGVALGHRGRSLHWNALPPGTDAGNPVLGGRDLPYSVYRDRVRPSDRRTDALEAGVPLVAWRLLAQEPSGKYRGPGPCRLVVSRAHRFRTPHRRLAPGAVSSAFFWRRIFFLLL